MFRIRPETPADYGAIAGVNRAAFGGDTEARLIELLRDARQVVASLVAEEDGRIVGHILFSGLRIETPNGVIMAASLAPMAVVPERQRQGIGTALVRAGLDQCRKEFLPAVIVVGHPDYYPRFGFSAELARNLKSPYSRSGDAWMALELAPGVLKGVSGTVHYPEAFSQVEA